MQRGNALAVLWLMFLAVAGALGQYDKPAFTPIFTRRPFIVAWNAPTQDCEPRFKVQLDYSVFDVQASPNEGFVDQNLTIFYRERLGLYPYYDANKVPINGGVPQNSSLERHLIRLTESIQKYIRSDSKEGLAVIDWEEWRPIWIRNWQPKDIYRNASRKLVLARRPKLQEDQLKKEAQYEFESSACDFMRETLRYAKSFRPRQLWGYYLFPDCYNHDYRNNQDSYTGHCPDVEKTRNDHLAWLWKESTALFPSIYLEPELANTVNGRKFVRSRVKEGLRISQQHHDNYALPVFVYTRPTYSNHQDLFLSEKNCQLIKTYIEEPLGHYIINVTTAAELCSQTLCRGHGRCRRQESEASIFLHLNPKSFQIYWNESKHPKPLLAAKGKLSQADISFLQTHFQCHCYQGWHGKGCEKQLNPPGGGRSTSYTLGLQLLMTVFLLVCLH
ncbi:hypothetical protein E2320_015188 [Naja naja]|nr:hypothetical protein E2320_015188 [Naja naja]